MRESLVKSSGLHKARRARTRRRYQSLKRSRLRNGGLDISRYLFSCSSKKKHTHTQFLLQIINLLDVARENNSQQTDNYENAREETTFYSETLIDNVKLSTRNLHPIR